MKLKNLFLLLAPTVFLVACETTPPVEKAAEQTVSSQPEIQENPWVASKAVLLEQLRLNPHLRVQEPDDQSIYVQIRSTNSFNSSGTTPSAQLLESLDGIANALEGLEQIQVEVAGHTDNVGNPQKNMELSAARAQVVVDYLVAKGLAMPITAVGYGSEKPVASNNTREGRSVNRRIDLLITPQP
ncbi:OmpA family protein [Lampropedia aestuarii]|uniref:OmpA family protein n=1 Tax=Lampropedia aestuarii TaxID=2562762 RepID=UPI002468E09F|nr:OmpA family protein [Lampropedia aestuarii]MDH5857400.1 OmpA family protein [Lampropedia aestuarii]